MKRREFMLALAATAFAWPPVAQAQTSPSLVPDIELTSRRAEIVALLAVSRKPAIYAWREAVQAGGLLSLGPDSADGHRRLARQLDRILKGVKPSDIPFERPTKFDLVVNLRAARTLGIDVPADLLARADEVIE